MINEFFATRVVFKNEQIGILHINCNGKSIFAMSHTEVGLLHALRDFSKEFDEEMIEAAKVEIQDLDLSREYSVYQILTGFWSTVVAENLLRLLERGLLFELTSDDLIFQDISYAYHEDEDNQCVYFSSFSNESKIIQFYSKAQGELMLDEISRTSDNAAIMSGFFNDLMHNAFMPDESDNVPNIVDGNFASLIAAIIVIIGKSDGPIEQQQSGIAQVVGGNYPWRDNITNN